MNKAVTAVKKKKVKRVVPTGVATISASFNNTIITFADLAGDVLTWSSSGNKGFKGSRRGTPFAAQMAAEDAAKKAMESGMRSCSVVVTGPGSGRESAIRAISATGMKVTSIRDVTPVPHNGCRPAKKRNP